MVATLGEAVGAIRLDLSGVTSAANQFTRDLGRMEASFDSIVRAARSASAMIATSVTALAATTAGAAAIGIRAYTSWGEQIRTLQDIFGGTSEEIATVAVGMNRIGLSVEEGSAAFAYFVRNVEQTRETLEKSSVAIADLRTQIDTINESLHETRINIAQETFERVRGIETALAEQITSINESLADRLEDIAYQRAKIERDLAKSLTKFDLNTKEALRNAHSARERREIRRRRAEERKEMIERAEEQKAELARQEARAREQAAKQIAIAETTARKQIEAAERAADKQIEAAERAADKQIAAIERMIRKQQEQVRASTPMLKALETLGLKFEDIDAKPFYEQLAIIMDAFQKLPADSKAAKAALDLFGRSGFKFLDFLRSNRAEASKMAKEFGLIIDPNEAARFSLALNEIQLRLTGLGVTIGKTVLPYARDFIAFLRQVIDTLSPAIQGALIRLSDAFQKGGWQGAFDQLGKELESIRNNPQVRAGVERAMQWLGDAIGFALTGVIEGAKWIGGVVAALLGNISKWFATDEGKARTTEAAYNIGTMLVNAIAKFVEVVANVSVALVSLCGTLIQWAASPEGKAWLGAVGSAFVNGIVDGIVKQWAKIDWSSLFPSPAVQAESQRAAEEYFKSGGTIWGMPNRPPGGSSSSIGGIISRQFGGYVPHNTLAYLHAGEYVLPRREVEAQRRGAHNLVVNITHNWSGTVAAYDRNAIEQIAERAAYRGIRTALLAA